MEDGDELSSGGCVGKENESASGLVFVHVSQERLTAGRENKLLLDNLKEVTGEG